MNSSIEPKWLPAFFLWCNQFTRSVDLPEPSSPTTKIVPFISSVSASQNLSNVADKPSISWYTKSCKEPVVRIEAYTLWI